MTTPPAGTGSSSDRAGDRSTTGRERWHLAAVGRLARIGASLVVLAIAFVLGAVVLHVAGSDPRGPIELAAVPDVDAAQGTGDGFHEVDGVRVERMQRATGAGADAFGTDDAADPAPSSSGATGATGGPSSTGAGAGGSATDNEPRGRSPVATSPDAPTDSTPTTAPALPGAPVLPPLTTPPVTLPPVTLPGVTLPPVVGEPPLTIPTVPGVTLPKVTVPRSSPPSRGSRCRRSPSLR
jgi:hypothetical protein